VGAGRASESRQVAAVDRSESIARDHLAFRGYSNVVYEPNRNQPPDFLIDNRIAVEVRRLNQHDRAGRRGLEETATPFTMRLGRLLRSFGSSNVGTRWIRLSLSRPLPKWSRFEPIAREFLGRVALEDSPIGASVQVSDRVELEYVHLSAGAGDSFALASIHDRESGGLVVAELVRNIGLVAEEKTRKIQPFRLDYAEWWLLLVDTIAYGLSDRDQADLASHLQLADVWDRIVLVSPLDPQRYFEIPAPIRPT
jgi:hypothetical protein